MAVTLERGNEKNRSRHGILLLGNHFSEKENCKDQERKLTFNFNELINNLKKEALGYFSK